MTAAPDPLPCAGSATCATAVPNAEPSRAIEHCAPGLITRAVFAVGIAAMLLWSVPLGSDAQILGNDALPYAENLRRDGLKGALSPHHPGTQLGAFSVYRLGAALGLLEPGFRGALTALRLVSALGAGLCAAWIWAFGTRCLERWSGLFLALAFATCAGNWLYGAVGETYLPAAFALAGLLSGLCEAALRHERIPIARASFWLFLACVLRQDSVLVVPFVLLLAGGRAGGIVVASAGLATLLAYLGFHHGSASPLPFLPWLRGLADTGLWGGGFSFEKLGISIGVTQHALHYGLRYPGWPVVLSLTTGAALLLATLALGRPNHGFAAGRRRKPYARCLAALLGFVLLRLCFFSWWQPGNMEYHTANLVPLFLAATLWMGRGRHRALPVRRQAVLALVAASLAIGNWLYLIGPNRGAGLQDRAKEALAAGGAGALLVPLDPLESYVLLRDAEGWARVDASPWATGLDPSRPEALLAEVRAALALGRRVVLLRESLLMSRLRFPQTHVAPELLAELAALATRTQSLRETDGTPYALILEP